MNVTEIIVFCYGDANKLSTWSNVPYLFTKALAKKNINVHNVDITPPSVIKKWHNSIIWRIIRTFFPGNQYDFIRSWFCKQIINNRINGAVKHYSSADYCLFFCFDYYNPFSTIPSILFGDWTYEIYLKERLNKRVDMFERRFIRQQNKAISEASLVISLFPDMAAKIKEAVPSAKLYINRLNVVNDASMRIYTKEEILRKKEASRKLLFVGKMNYLSGAEILIDAFQVFNQTQKVPYSLHIIGLNEKDVHFKYNDNIYFYGYLDKGNISENGLYYSLLAEARAIINPTKQWAGISSLIEAMYFYTPVITSSFSSFVDLFGTSINFGQYYDGNKIRELACLISKVVSSSDYLSLCLNAHNATKDFTWDNYIEELLNFIS